MSSGAAWEDLKTGVKTPHEVGTDRAGHRPGLDDHRCVALLLDDAGRAEALPGHQTLTEAVAWAAGNRLTATSHMHRSARSRPKNRAGQTVSGARTSASRAS